MELRELMQHLKESEVFSALANEDLTKLARGCREVRFKLGDRVVQMGTQRKEAYLLLSGSVSIHLEVEEEQVPLTILHAPYVVGAAAFLDPPVEQVTVKALTPLRGIAVPREAFLALVEANPRGGYEVLRRLSTRILNLVREVWETLFRVSKNL